MALSPRYITERLLLQPLQPQHAEDLLKIFSFDEVRSQMLTTRFSTISETVRWIDAASNRPNASIFSISLRQDLPTPGSPEMIGIIGLNSFDRLLYSLHPDFWGAGYCTEALRWFLKELFDTQPERIRVVAGVHLGNERSVRVLLKCGFVEADSLQDARNGLSKRRNSDNEGRNAANQSLTANSHSEFTWFRFEEQLEIKQ